MTPDSISGRVKWTLHWIPVTEGANVVAV